MKWNLRKAKDAADGETQSETKPKKDKRAEKSPRAGNMKLGKAVRIPTVKMSSKRGKGNLFTKFALIIFAVFVGVSVFNMQTQVTQLKGEQVKLSQEIEKYQNSIDELNADLDTPYDDAYKIKIARKKLGLCFPEELMYYNDISN